MTEDYLHYVWRYKLFDHSNLYTTEGEEIEIKEYGIHNHDSGPDFSHAKIKIRETTWVGNIEIHIDSSAWYKHQHQEDKAYDTVILHVVYNHDRIVKTTKGGIIPVLELKSRIDYTQYADYEQFIFPLIPCGNSLRQVPDSVISSTLEQMLIERLINKSEEIQEELERTQYYWDQVFFQFIAKAMGMKINSHPMQELAKNTEVKLFYKLGDNLMAIESILFGQAGFLEEDRVGGEYFKALKKEYVFHQAKHNLIPINKVFWKLSKLRPSNFPTLRIAQLAKLLMNNNQLFDLLIVKENSYAEIKKRLTISLEDGFWLNHYTFDKESKLAKKAIGVNLINSIIINTIVPFLYSYGKYKDEKVFMERAMKLLAEIPSEDNKITRIFKDKIPIKNSAASQGITHCHNNYCVNKKCLKCSIGIYLMKKK